MQIRICKVVECLEQGSVANLRNGSDRLGRSCNEIGRRCRRELRKTNRSWRVDETYLRVAGKSTYLYRAVDSSGDTIDFLLSPTRDAGAAKRFFQKALRSPNHPSPRVINVDRNPAYPSAIQELKRTRELGWHCRCRPIRYLNNVVEQDHRSTKRRVKAMQGFRAFHAAWPTIQRIETVNMIRKGRIRWLAKSTSSDRLHSYQIYAKSQSLPDHSPSNVSSRS